MGQLFDLLNFLRTQMICSCLRFPRVKLWASAWTSQENKLGVCLNFPRPESKTVRQLFEFIKTQDRNSWSVVWASQEQNIEQVFELPQTNFLCNCLRIPRLLVSRSCLNFPIFKTGQLVNCLNFQRSEIKTLRKFLLSPRTTYDPKPKHFGSCLKFSRIVN